MAVGFFDCFSRNVFLCIPVEQLSDEIYSANFGELSLVVFSGITSQLDNYSWVACPVGELAGESC